MRVLITFKVGDGKGWNHTRHFDLDLGESETLKRDFLTHINGGIGALSGASYRCIDPDTGQPRELAIRFSDILYVEFMPQTGTTDFQSQSQAAGKPSSGPLQTRLSTSPLQSRNLGGGGKEEE
jgi:hypothetical protein